MIEILLLTLKPGTRDEFHQLYVTRSLPLQKKWNIEVLAYGPSLHDTDSYYVVRSFQNLAQRQNMHDEFYNSDDWQKGPREAILGRIENISTVVVANDTLTGWASLLK
jgi:NIPSNAP